MGGGSWTSDAYRTISSSYAGKSTHDVFTAKSMASDMSPLGLTVRESRDSDEHPESVAVIVALDVTGSMGRVADSIAREKMGAIMPTIMNHGVPHPQVLFLGIGDQYSDSAPLQVGQYESSAELLDKWLTGIFLEGGGGSQSMESYPLAWLVAGRHVSIDCFEKRGQKGFLFTMGDEWLHEFIEPEKVEKILGYRPQEKLSASALLEEARRTHHVFHLHINDGSYRDREDIMTPWRKMLGEAFIVTDSDHCVEVMATTIAVINGADVKKVAADFGSKSAAIMKSVSAIVPATKAGVPAANTAAGIVAV